VFIFHNNFYDWGNKENQLPLTTVFISNTRKNKLTNFHRKKRKEKLTSEQLYNLKKLANKNYTDS